MLPYLLRRTAWMLPLSLGIVLIVWGLMQIVPGDPAAVLLGEEATEESLVAMRHLLGLDRPPIVQLGSYLGKLLRGNLGESILHRRPVVRDVFDRLPATMELAIAALFISIIIGIPLGVIAAIRRDSIIDAASTLFAQLGVSMPIFWLGILLMLWFSVRLGWLPAVGRGEPLYVAIGAMFSGHPEVLLESLSHLVLPAASLGMFGTAYVMRITRSSMLDTLSQDYVRTALSKGLRRTTVIRRHALRNALIPVVSVVGLQLGALLGGAVLTETIFAWPGLGQLIVTAISQRDYPLVQGAILIVALLFACVNLAVDLLYGVIDPRIRLE